MRENEKRSRVRSSARDTKKGGNVYRQNTTLLHGYFVPIYVPLGNAVWRIGVKSVSNFSNLECLKKFKV